MNIVTIARFLVPLLLLVSPLAGAQGPDEEPRIACQFLSDIRLKDAGEPDFKQIPAASTAAEKMVFKDAENKVTGTGFFGKTNNTIVMMIRDDQNDSDDNETYTQMTLSNPGVRADGSRVRDGKGFDPKTLNTFPNRVIRRIHGRLFVLECAVFLKPE